MDQQLKQSTANQLIVVAPQEECNLLFYVNSFLQFMLSCMSDLSTRKQKVFLKAAV